MIKKYKRSNSGYMRRTARIYFTEVNAGKLKQLSTFLLFYSQIVNYYIELFWSSKNFSSQLASKTITDRAVVRFNITARLAQAASKQAKEIVNSQRKKVEKQRTMPLFKNIAVNLDSRFFEISAFKGRFDYALTFNSGLPNIVIPFNKTKPTNTFVNNGWTLAKSIRLGLKKKSLFIDLIYEKPIPALKKTGEILGVDLGYRVPLATSDKQLLGTELKAKIEKIGKRRKSYHHYVETEVNRYVKQIDLSKIKTVAIEKLKNVKSKKRGKFSRRVNRLLSMWQYAKVTKKLEQRCEEEGVLLKFKAPWKTSQHCPSCGKIDDKSRKGDRFKCTGCGFEEHADVVGALNLKALELAGVYSLRSLKSK
jgi:IS605 OrfB family transposase